MRFILLLLLTAVLCYLTLYIMPWWIPMLIAFLLVIIFPVRGGQAFVSTGTGAALCYLIITFFADRANEQILSRKMAELFGLPSTSLLLVLTALIGFITAGLGGWSGSFLRQMFQRPSKTGGATGLPEQQ